jgi:type IV secretory pathway TraG/TraD family ATPase VirD4
LLGLVLLIPLTWIVTDWAAKALGFSHSRALMRYVAGVLFFGVTSLPALIFTAVSLVRNRRFDCAQYVDLFSPGARLWYAISLSTITGLTVDLMFGPPGKDRIIPGWVLGLGSIALYYSVPVWLAKRASAARAPRTPSGAFGLYLGTSTGTFGELSHGAGIKRGQNVVLSLEDAAQNILVFGGIGSGKTTRAIQPLLSQLLDQDCGGLIFDVKGDFKQAVAALARDANREIVTIGPERTRMNVLSGLTPEVASSFLKSAFLLNQGGSFEAFWVDTATELSKNALGVLSFLPGKYSLSGLYQYLYDKDERAAIDEALSLLITSGQLPERDQRLLKTYQGYHDAVFSNFEDKVKSGVNATIAQILSPFNHPDLIDAFCTDDPGAPSMEAVLNGVVYLVDMPTTRWGLGGRVAYSFIKLRFFNVLQRRNVEEGWNKDRPVFFMCDEYQEVVSASRDGLSDLNFWDKSRSSKCIGIISGQAVSSFYAAIGSHDLANTLMQNFRQKICFRTEDKTTIETLNHLLGRVEVEKVSKSSSKTTPAIFSGSHASTTDSTSKSMIERQVINPQLFRQLEPNQAVTLLSVGGRAMDDVVTCVPIFVS